LNLEFRTVADARKVFADALGGAADGVARREGIPAPRNCDRCGRWLGTWPNVFQHAMLDCPDRKGAA
jgi:hypothetical protein